MLKKKSKFSDVFKKKRKKLVAYLALLVQLNQNIERAYLHSTDLFAKFLEQLHYDVETT